MSARANPLANLLPLILAGLLAGVSFWLEQASRVQYDGGGGKVRHDPDYIVDDFVLRRFNAEGALVHTLVGGQMKHFPDDDSTIVYEPRHIFHRDPPTFVVAREAHVDGNGEHVRLIDDVRVMRGGKPDKPDTVITTQVLDAYPDDEISKTDVPVTITQDKSQIQGDTLIANNKTSIYVLEGQVHGVFFRNGGKLAPRGATLVTQPKTSEAALPASRPTSVPVVQPKPKQQVKQQTKQQVKPQTKQQVKPQTKQQVKPQTKQQTKPPIKPPTNPKPQAKPIPKSKPTPKIAH